jgi:hypothetical protein
MNRPTLETLYYDPSRGLSRKNLITQGLKHEYTSDEINEFLQSQEAVQLHKPKPIPNYVPISGVPGTVQCDLTFYEQYASSNKGFDIILTVIEINSRRAYCRPLKNKTQANVIQAFKEIIEESQKYIPIVSVTSDQGSEFSKEFVSFLEKQGISHYYTNVGDKHALGRAERFNRTIRGLIEKYMTAYNTHTWFNILDELVKNYNNTVHSSTGFAPNKVGEEELIMIRKRQSEKTNKVLDSMMRLQVGDKVRKIKNKSILDKKTGESWSRTVYTIKEVNHFSYVLENNEGTELKGTYKDYELQKVDTVEEFEGKSKTFDREKHKKEYKVSRSLKTEGVDSSNIMTHNRRNK